MTGGTRIVAVDAGAPESAPAEEQTILTGHAPAEAEEVWEEPEELRPSRDWTRLISGTLALAGVVAWSVLFGLVYGSQIMAGGTPEQWLGWIRDWSVPVLLIGVLWLIAMRNSRREAARFGETARMLGEESRLLETRMVTVNRELSLAREFLAAQSRDLESLGRVATERLSQHSEKLAGLVVDNSTRIDAISTVSSAALENMEKLRGQLPVIASSTKDVTNTIAAAGRTAHSQLEDLIAGFNRLNQFGQASERQVNALREVIDTALQEFTRQTDQLDAQTTNRFAALADRGAEFRTQLETHEVEALAAIRSRAAAMAEELEAARLQLDGHEAESLTSLRARLGAVRDEGAAIARSLREGEGAALDAWRKAIGQLEEDLREAVARVGEIDEKALESARNRLATLTEEAEQVDARMLERDRAFAEEIARRRADFETQHSEFSQGLTARMAALDDELAARRTQHEEQRTQLLAHGEAINDHLSNFSQRMAEVSAHGSQAEQAIAASLTNLAEKLLASREALSGTDKAIEGLTDSSVRLLELIQASVEHSRENLPGAISAGEERLAELERRTFALRDAVTEAHERTEALSGHVGTSNEGLAEAAKQAEKHLGTLNSMQKSVTSLQQESTALAMMVQGELAAAIAKLEHNARDAVAGIENMSAAKISALAANLGDASAEAIDQALRSRVAEAAGQLEQAASHASGVSRDAAVQLRDQLAKVAELATNLERRVAHARERAEEQVDNDFARRVALITESLNSNAIDIARVLDTDVTDTAWAAYLKGDRGIFTRRAVKLLETSEAKAVAQFYEGDQAFRDHVSRYIHDFEAMLRQLLSTRDGHALGVTLLSSDMGKLYVALAQAIERLRN